MQTTPLNDGVLREDSGSEDREEDAVDVVGRGAYPEVASRGRDDAAEDDARDDAGDDAGFVPARVPSASVGANASLSVGTILGRARQRQGIDLTQVEKATRISREHIVAIEENDIQSLPERAYVLGFIKTYATFLGLDAETCMRRFKDEHVKPEDPARQIYSNFAEQAPGKRLKMSGIAFAVLGLGLSVAWYASTSDGQARLHAFSGQDRVEVAELSGGSLTDAAMANTASAKIAVSGEAVPVAETVPSLDAAQPVVVRGTGMGGPDDAVSRDVSDAQSLPDVTNDAYANWGTAAVPSTEAGVYGARAGRLRLVAMDPVWVMIEDNANGLVFEKTLKPGDVFRVADSQSIAVTVRNAGSLSVMVDDTALGRLGEAGEIFMGKALALSDYLP